MDMNGKDVKCDLEKKNLSNDESPRSDVNSECEVDDESQTLLPPKKGGLSKNLGRPGRKVQWVDTHGDKLAEILEFQPSDYSDSDDEDSDSCICKIM